jgi:predicted chitinase
VGKGFFGRGAAAEAAEAGTSLVVGGEAAAAGTSLVAGLATGLGATAAAVGGILASPVVLGAAALAVGYGAYKHFKNAHIKSKLGPLGELRMAQYGFTMDDLDKVSSVLDFEAMVKPHVIYGADGKPKFDDKKLKISEAIGPFGINPKNQRDLRSWLQWYQGRFKPVFLSWMAALHGIAPKADLGKLDGLKKEEKLKLLNAVKNPSGPYGRMASPFGGSSFMFMHWGGSLKASFKEVEAATDAAEKAIEKEPDSAKKPGALARFGAGVVAGVTGDKGKQELGKDGKPIPKTFAQKAGEAVGKALKWTPLGLGIMGVHWLGHLFDKKKDDAKSTKPTASVGIDKSLMKVEGKVDALTALRYKTYGLVELDQDKVSALKALEDVCMQYVNTKAKLTDYNTYFNGDPEKILKQVGASFGVVGVNNTKGYRWMSWFNLRFLPTFLTYVGSLTKATGKADIHQAFLEPLVAAKLAPLIMGAKTPEGKSVWTVTQSPWTKYDLNTDEKSVQPYIDFLNGKVSNKKIQDPVTATQKNSQSKLAKAATKVLGAATGSKDAKADETNKPKPTQQGDNGKGWVNELENKAGNAWDQLKSWVGNVWNGAKNTVSNVVSGAWNGAKNVYNKAKGAVSNAASGVGDSLKGFGASLGKAYQAVKGNVKQVKDAALAALAKAGITNPTEQAMFMAQMDHESGGFKSLSENLNYRAGTLSSLFGKYLTKAGVSAAQLAAGGPEAIANVIYGGRMGNTAQGDGFKYRGRGIIQLTGKDNYAKYGKMLGLDLVNNPDLASDPKVAAMIAVAYWKSRVSSSAAQSGDVATVTRQINGGENGLGDRQAKFQQYLQQAKSGQLNPSGQAGSATASTGSDSGASGIVKVSATSATGTPAATSNAPTTPAPKSTATSAGASVASTGTPMSGGVTPTTTPSSSSSAPAASPSGSSMDSSMAMNPFAFGAGSAKQMGGGGSRNIMAVQQAQHEDKMSAIGDVGDVLNKQLAVQTDTRNTLNAILKIVSGIQQGGGSGGQQQGTSSSAPQPNAPVSSNRGTPQQMATPPVSMAKMV